MSNSFEGQLSISACLDQTKQAFNDGGAIIEKIKRKRALKRAPPPPRLLEESLDQAPHDIETEKQKGLERFGQAFDEGDHIAIIQLQHITIQLQASLLGKLRNTAFDDDTKITDFSYLVDVVELGRDRTIAALHELRHRLSASSTPLAEAQQTPSPDSSKDNLGIITPPPERPGPVRREPTERTSSVIHHPPQREEAKPVQKQPTWTRDLGQSAEASGDDDMSIHSGHQAHHRKRSSILHFLKHTRTHSHAFDKEKLQPPSEEPSRHGSVSPAAPTSVPFRPPPTCDASNENTSAQAQGGASQRFTYEEWDQGSSEMWNKPGLERRDTVALAPDAAPQSDSLSRQMSNVSNTSHPLTPPSPVLTLRSNSILSHLYSLHSQQSTHTGSISVSIPTPTPENEYLGFCKSAWKLQNGDRKGSFSKCRDVEPWSRHPTSTANAMMYLTCQSNKCAFRSVFTARDTDKIWERLISAEKKGVKMRWSFLAKSHVMQKVVVKQQYSFKCLFCVFLTGQSGVYHGVDYYIDHISSQHRGRAVSEVILYKTGCINDRKAEETEEFDINVWPDDSIMEKKDRQKSEWLSDDLMWDSGGYGGPKDGHDSMFSANEPWNEGLSDFSYRGEFDRELE